MAPQKLEKLKYPIGPFQAPESITAEVVKNWIDELEAFPDKLIALTQNLTDEQLETPYRPDGWTLRQTIHHIGDSHANSYIRFKWTATEDQPIIKAYNEKDWSELEDTKSEPIDVSLLFIKALHAKLCQHLRTLTPQQLKRTFIHPETNDTVVLDWNIGNYVWHGNHHYAHIAETIKRHNW